MRARKHLLHSFRISVLEVSCGCLSEPGAGRGSRASTEMGVEMAQMDPAPNQEAYM